jgi:hypothetical protein
MVRVTFTDVVGNGHSLNSIPLAIPPPLFIPDEDGLTAAASNEPSSHDGSAAFTFELHFSQEISMGYETMRDNVFDVTGGTVTGARRLVRGSNIGWEIRVGSSGNGDLVITLPVTTDCEAEGAVCTHDGRMLSEEVEITVSGPGG